MSDMENYVNDEDDCCVLCGQSIYVEPGEELSDPPMHYECEIEHLKEQLAEKEAEIDRLNMLLAGNYEGYKQSLSNDDNKEAV